MINSVIFPSVVNHTIVNELNKLTCNLSLRASEPKPRAKRGGSNPMRFLTLFGTTLGRIASGYCPRNDNFLGSSTII